MKITETLEANKLYIINNKIYKTTKCPPNHPLAYILAHPYNKNNIENYFFEQKTIAVEIDEDELYIWDTLM